jgi:hypothetical protein
MTAEGPATVTLTDDERALGHGAIDPYGHREPVLVYVQSAVESIVAARVAALTADLATAREHVCPVRECFTARRDLAAARLARSVLMDELNDMTRDNDERARVIANVRALANEWREEGESLVRNAHSGRDVHEGMTLVKCADAAVALLPAAPTGEGS